MTELVSEERLEEVVRTALAANFFSIPRRVRLAVGRAVLEELGITKVMEWKRNADCIFWDAENNLCQAFGNDCFPEVEMRGKTATGKMLAPSHCRMPEGAVLVKARQEEAGSEPRG